MFNYTDRQLADGRPIISKADEYGQRRVDQTALCRAQSLRGRASDSRLRKPGFESCAVVLKPWESVFALPFSSSLSCINEYLTIDSGGYVYESLRALIVAHGRTLPREAEVVSE